MTDIQTIEQSDAAIRETFYNMEEGVDYVLNDFWFAETNRVRKEYCSPPMKDKPQYKLTRKGDKMFIDNNFVFDFTGKSNLALEIVYAFADTLSDQEIAFAFAFAFTLAFALQHNGIEKLNKDTCDGKVVEIDGKKYKLTAV